MEKEQRLGGHAKRSRVRQAEQGICRTQLMHGDEKGFRKMDKGRIQCLVWHGRKNDKKWSVKRCNEATTPVKMNRKPSKNAANVWKVKYFWRCGGRAQHGIIVFVSARAV